MPASRMEKAVEALKKDFSGLRTGRASTALLDGIMVEAYGAMTPLVQIGTVSVPESRMLSVQVWDRSMVKSVEKAIRDAGLGLNPMNDGQLIRIPIPPLNEERRIELTKIASKYTEQARVAVRNIRRDAMDAVKKMSIVLVIGIVVDDAIMVVENVERSKHIPLTDMTGAFRQSPKQSLLSGPLL